MIPSAPLFPPLAPISGPVIGEAGGCQCQPSLPPSAQDEFPSTRRRFQITLNFSQVKPSMFSTSFEYIKDSCSC